MKKDKEVCMIHGTPLLPVINDNGSIGEKMCPVVCCKGR